MLAQRRGQVTGVSPDMPNQATAESPVVIVAGADEAFAVGLAALGSSVIRHRPRGRRLDLYIVDAGIAWKTRERLAASWAADDTRVHWLRLDRAILERCGLHVHGARQASCIRLVLDLLMPSDVHRLLCLDADTLALSDLTPLWDVDLEGHALAAVQDTMIHHIQSDSYVPEEIDRSDPLPNFNAGVALIDLDRWRSEGVCQTARDLVQRHHDRIWGIDQQSLNWALVGRWKRLPLVWNRMSHVLAIPSYRCTCFSRQEFEDALRHPRIAHFAGTPKPWHAGCRDDRTADFIAAMQHTAWAPWQPPQRRVAERIADTLWRQPHRQYRFVRRGLRLAERERLPKGPWYRSAGRVALRYPWFVLILSIRSVVNRLQRQRPARR